VAQIEKSATDEQAQADYVAAWRVDRALQLAAGVSNFCTSPMDRDL